MKVLIAYNQGWSRFHRDPFCSGLRKGEIANGLDYVTRDLDDLPETVKPCQFECCFKGYPTTADLKSRVHDRLASQPIAGVRVGQEVEWRELGKSKTTKRRIVRGPTNQDKGELSADTPIARELLGHDPGEVVDIALSNRVMRVEIVSVR